MISKLILIFVSVIILCSCHEDNKRIDPLPEDFLMAVNDADKMIVSYDDTLRLSQGAIDTVITNHFEVEQMKSWIRQSVKSDTCYKWTGGIAFRDKKDNGMAIDISLADDCQAFFYYLDRKPVTFTMPKECVIYLRKIMKNSQTYP